MTAERALTPAQEQIAKAMGEATLQREVMKTLAMWEWRSYHSWSSRHSSAGFPDIVAVRGLRVIFAELKKEDGELSTAQEEWIGALRVTITLARSDIVEVYVWRPSDLLSGRIDEVLREAGR